MLKYYLLLVDGILVQVHFLIWLEDEQLRKDFVQQATQFILDHQLDGLDIDWVEIIERKSKLKSNFHFYRNILLIEMVVDQKINNYLQLSSKFVCFMKNKFYQIDSRYFFRN